MALQENSWKALHAFHSHHWHPKSGWSVRTFIHPLGTEQNYLSLDELKLVTDCKFLLTVRRLETNLWTPNAKSFLASCLTYYLVMNLCCSIFENLCLRKDIVYTLKKRTCESETPISVGSLMIWAHLQILELHYWKCPVLSVTSYLLGTLKRPGPLNTRFLVTGSI